MQKNNTLFLSLTDNIDYVTDTIGKSNHITGESVNMMRRPIESFFYATIIRNFYKNIELNSLEELEVTEYEKKELFEKYNLLFKKATNIIKSDDCEENITYEDYDEFKKYLIETKVFFPVLKYLEETLMFDKCKELVDEFLEKDDF